MEIIQGILFWLIAGAITGVVSGAMTAKAINDRKRGRYFHEGHTPIKYLIGGLLGVGVAYLIFQQYFSGIQWLPALFGAWFPLEILVKKWLVRRGDSQLSATLTS